VIGVNLSSFLELLLQLGAFPRKAEEAFLHLLGELRIEVVDVAVARGRNVCDL
jgi:hypothetical protein